jgi:hypothetical protein
MSATMMDMELKFADTLTPDQLMVNDLIAINDEIVELIGIESDGTGTIYTIVYKDEFDEKEVSELKFDEQVSLYVYVDDDE